MWRQRCEAAERRCAELEATVARLQTEAQAATVAAGAAASVAAVEAAALAARTAAAAEMDVLRSQNQQGEVALAAVQGQLREATAAVKAREAELETLVAEHARREEETRKLLDQLALAGQGYEAELAARDQALEAARAEAAAARAATAADLAAVTAAVTAELEAYKAETEASMREMQGTLQERAAALAGAQDQVTEQSARIVALKAHVDKLERAAAERELLVRHQRDELDKYHARGVLPGVEEAGTPRAEAAAAQEEVLDANAFAISEYAGLSRWVMAGRACMSCVGRVCGGHMAHAVLSWLHGVYATNAYHHGVRKAYKQHAGSTRRRWPCSPVARWRSGCRWSTSSMARS